MHSGSVSLSFPDVLRITCRQAFGEWTKLRFDPDLHVPPRYIFIYLIYVHVSIYSHLRLQESFIRELVVVLAGPPSFDFSFQMQDYSSNEHRISRKFGLMSHFFIDI